MTEFYFWTCQRDAINTADGIMLLVYKFIIHAAALFLIFSVRKIKLSALNDYKANSIIVFVQTAMFLILIVSLSLLANYPSFFALMSGTMIFIGSTSFLGLTFIPKVSTYTILCVDGRILLLKQNTCWCNIFILEQH